MEIQTILKDGLAALGLSTDCVEKLERYGTALVEKNKVMNLTAITDPAGVAQKHMLDCAAVLGAAEFDKKRVIDVGTGAGFPGLVLKICDGSIDLTLLDSLQKRVDWLAEISTGLDAAGRCITLLGGRLMKPYRYTIPGTDLTRQVIRIEKIAPTPEKYPRRFAKIQKAPL